MGYRMTVDDSEWERELDRLADLDRPVRECEQLLARQHAATQAAVHVITGSLKASGRSPKSSFAAGRWEGVISYGGPAPGMVNNPVRYAAYEMARGGAHDFRAPAVAYDAEYGRIVARHLDGGVR